MSDEVKVQFVKKLDIPAEFEAIPSDRLTVSSLKEHEQTKYNTWFNHFKTTNPSIMPRSKGPLKWIADNHELIAKYIRDTYIPPEYKPSTLRNHLEALANLLLAIDKNKFKEVARPFFNTGLSIQQIIDKENEDSLLSDRELANFVTYEQLVKRRDELQKEWLANPKDLKLNMFHMILALNTYVPPLRLNWLNMNIYPPRIVDGKTVKPTISGTPPPENRENYLWEHTPGQWTIVLNYDKIQSKREKKGLPRRMYRLADEIEGVTDGHRLNELINQSLGAYPRNYVLIGIKTHLAMGESGYNSALASMFAPKKPTQNVLRKAYVNYWHSKNLSVGKLKDIAEKMQHSLGVALGSYKKVNASGNVSSEPEVKETKVPEPSTLPIVPPAEVKSLPIIPPTPPPPVLTSRTYFQPVDYARKYRAANHDEILRKQRERYAKDAASVLRYKVLYNLNRNLATRPHADTIAKYGLYQDQHSGKWKSRHVIRAAEENE